MRERGETLAPTATPELDEALAGGFGLAIRIRQSLAEGSAGGKQVTVDELLNSVTDAAMKESVRDLVEAIDMIAHGDHADIFQLIPIAVGAVMDFLANLRDALADDRVTIDEILHGLTNNGHLRPDLVKAIDGVGKIPGELENMDMWKMVAITQRVSGYLPALLAKS